MQDANQKDRGGTGEMAGRGRTWRCGYLNLEVEMRGMLGDAPQCLLHKNLSHEFVCASTKKIEDRTQSVCASHTLISVCDTQTLDLILGALQ
jgi:hypothetical protein